MKNNKESRSDKEYIKLLQSGYTHLAKYLKKNFPDMPQDEGPVKAAIEIMKNLKTK